MKHVSLIHHIYATIKEQRWFFFFFFLTVIYTFLYSYTQVDLSLTMSRASVFQSIEKSFQYIGYFNRPLSTALFIIMIILWIINYCIIVSKAQAKNITRRAMWVLFLLMAVILTFSYNAFSYDLFNYIFDAKILTFYHQNPYLHKALDFPSDPMLSFMHWTHRAYPYGPVWLLVTLPFSLLGFHIFIVTFFLFKAGIVAAFVGTVYLIEKIVLAIDSKRSLIAVALVAFHPLLIIENLISAHNDSTMLFFVFLGIYLMVCKNNSVTGIISYAISVATKFATVFLIPSYLFLFVVRKKMGERIWNLFFLLSGILMMLAVLVPSRQTYQPWYSTWPLIFFLLLPFNHFKKLVYFVAATSTVMLVVYVPFLYTGNWDTAIPSNFFIILWGVLAVLFGIFWIREYFSTQRNVTT